MDTQEGKKKFYKRWWFWVGTVVVLFIVIGASGGGSSSSPSASAGNSSNSQPVEAMKVTSAEIVADYKENGVAADAKYKDKLVEISGTVETIDKDILDTPYIALESYQYAIVDKVQCMFSRSNESELATVAKGQKITLRGKVEGKLGNILVRGCEIVK